MRIRTPHLRATTARGRRQGHLAVELLLVLPLFLIALAMVIEFGVILTARQELMAASREACRVAAHGGDDDEVKAAAQRVLGKGRLGSATVVIDRFEDDPVPPNGPRDRVQVVVHVPITKLVPDFLGWVGVTFAGQELVAGTVMSQEEGERPPKSQGGK